jgi:dihydroorotase
MLKSQAILLQNVHSCLDGSDVFFPELKIQGGQRVDSFADESDVVVVDAKGAKALPLLAELNVQFHEPGAEHIYSLAEGVSAMYRGGYGTALLSPDTVLIPDDSAKVRRLVEMTEAHPVRLLVQGAVSVEHRDQLLVEMAEMQREGAVAFGTGLRATPPTKFLRSLMEYSTVIGSRLFFLPLESGLTGSCSVNEGVYASQLGLKGVPLAAEEIAVFRILHLALLTGAKVHLQLLTSPGSIEILQSFKSRGVDVTCDVGLAHLLLDDGMLLELNANHHLVPPIRSSKERLGMIECVKQGLVDALSSAHVPVLPDSKATYFEGTLPGVLGLETAWLLAMKLGFSVETALQLMSVNPLRILNQTSTNLEFFLWDAEGVTDVNPELFAGRVDNSPWLNTSLRGRLIGTFAGGIWRGG